MDPKDLTSNSIPPASPGVEQQIPSAVASPSAFTPWTLAGAVTAALIVCAVAFSTRHKHDSAAPVQAAEPPLSPLTPAMTQPASSGLPALSARSIASSPVDLSQAEDSLARMLRSPMVIYNGSASGGILPNAFGLPPGRQPPQGAAVARPPGAPLPANFNPSSEASSHSTSIGDREYVIAEGKLLDAILESAINSDHPGLLRALITNDIYGDTGRTVLLPRGTRLIGEYDSDVQQGQNRVFILWKRAIRPDGIDIQLGSAGTDPVGETGIRGNVNHHFFLMLGAATLLSVIGATASIADVSSADQPNSVAAYREAITHGFSDASNTVLSQFARIKPTITIRQGMPVKVFVAKDLYFDRAAIDQSQGIEVVQ